MTRPIRFRRDSASPEETGELLGTLRRNECERAIARMGKGRVFRERWGPDRAQRLLLHWWAAGIRHDAELEQLRAALAKARGACKRLREERDEARGEIYDATMLGQAGVDIAEARTTRIRDGARAVIKELREVSDAAHAALATLREQYRWRPVSEEPPCCLSGVVVWEVINGTVDSRTVRFVWRSHAWRPWNEWCQIFEDVTHWRPLTPGPEGE